jgi:hypothetical protein
MSKQTTLLNFVSKDGLANAKNKASSKKRKRRITPVLVEEKQQPSATAPSKDVDAKQPPKKERKRITPTLVSTEINRASHAPPPFVSSSSSASSKTKKKKKRITPTLVSTETTVLPPPPPPLHSNVLTVTLSRDPNYQDHHAFLHTPATEIKTFGNHTDLQLFLNEMATKCANTSNKWMRDPTSTWIKTLFTELTAKQQSTVRVAHRKLNVSTASTLDERWYERSNLSTAIIEQWLDQKTLQQVIQKSKELGQMDQEEDGRLPLGFVLEGELVNSIGMDKDVHFDELYAMLQSLNRCKPKPADADGGGGSGGGGSSSSSSSSSSSADPTNKTEPLGNDESFESVPLVQPLHDPTNTVSMYENTKMNSFSIRETDTIHLKVLKERWKRTKRTTATQNPSKMTSVGFSSWGSTLDGCGSLNTTFHYGEFNGDASDLPQVDMLHEYFKAMNDLCEGCSSTIELNRRLYLLWKFKHYVTPHHQDTHITPHFTLYSQTSGCSVFHFLPPLIGLYLTHMGTTIGSHQHPHRIQQILQQLDEMKIGSVTTIGPGQMALIMPSGSHGVFVPLVESGGRNSHLGFQPFDVSLIRAAELYVAPMREELTRLLMNEEEQGWNFVLPSSNMEKSMLKTFETTQQKMLLDGGEDGGGMTKEEWFWCAQKMIRKWESHAGTK